MEHGNRSMVKEFVLLGLSQAREVQLFLFSLFLLFYSLILPGNILIIVTIRSDPRLGSPMYFFLANLAFLDICYCSVTPPKMLADFFYNSNTISYRGCMAQLFFLHWLGGSEVFLLLGMAIDRYVAICHPLHYASVVSRPICSTMMVLFWCLGFVHSIIQVILIVPLPFCGPNKLDNFFCDITQIVKLACTDTYDLEFFMFINSGLSALISFTLLIISYMILLVKVRMGSKEGKSKAASTCVTHIIIVVVMFGPAIFMYCRPFQDSPVDKLVAIFHSTVFPLLNPMIYTLRNKEIKHAMRKLLSKHRLLDWTGLV
ncbi:olfactory receptor 4N2-like [Hemicordylus capensis]|uniref:olfactory receptor 4N2-like n=1 Tax=Hemicordylus capensis TaxID=884348 RepID=UPI002304AD3D|nr:olfactory receptor 4N2-like [Hemicordylus capensis]